MRFQNPFWTSQQERLDMNRLLPSSAKSGIATLVLMAGMAVSGPVCAADSDGLIGNWKLVSWEVVVGNEKQNPFGSHPRGYLILTRQGRAMALTTADNRKPGPGDADRRRQALHRIGTGTEHIVPGQD
jgi:hypothetical protein